ncbi:hypothetical protein [Pseudomonas sp.]|uniref:hypothetical protein n=1 Tax=Pseudomonas sp. TaxID=306 RepID=UPI00333FDC50
MKTLQRIAAWTLAAALAVVAGVAHAEGSCGVGYNNTRWDLMVQSGNQVFSGGQYDSYQHAYASAVSQMDHCEGLLPGPPPATGSLAQIPVTSWAPIYPLWYELKGSCSGAGQVVHWYARPNCTACPNGDCEEPEPAQCNEPAYGKNGDGRDVGLVDLPSSVTAQQVVDATEICVNNCRVIPMNLGLVIQPNPTKYSQGSGGFVHYGVVMGTPGGNGLTCDPSAPVEPTPDTDDGRRCTDAKTSTGVTVARTCANKDDKNKISDGKNFNDQWSQVDADGFWDSDQNCTTLSSGGVLCKADAPPQDRPKDENGETEPHDATVLGRGEFGTGCTSNCSNSNTTEYHYYGPGTVGGGCGGTGQGSCGGTTGGDPGGGECDPETESCGGEGEGDCDPQTEECGQCQDDPETEENECGTGAEFTAPSIAYQYADSSQLVGAKRAEIAQFIQTARGEAQQLLSGLDGLGGGGSELPCWQAEVFGQTISFCPRDYSAELAILGQMILLIAALMAAFILLR